MKDFLLGEISGAAFCSASTTEKSDAYHRGQEMMLMFQNICNGDNIVFIPHKEASMLRLCS